MANVAAKEVIRIACLGALALAAICVNPPACWAAKFDEMGLDRWSKLGEADRYQLNIAEKYYRENNWTIALAEYEKFLSLYEKSEGAPFAQLKWSLCTANLRKQNTAIKDGYQSVIDYWPESPEAVTAAYLIAKTYKGMGEVAPAKKAYAKVLAEHPDELVAVMSRIDLAELARIEGDTKRRVSLWNEVVFTVERTKDNRQYCLETSQQLASHFFGEADFAGGVKALATSYADRPLDAQIAERLGPTNGPNERLPSPLARLVADPQTKARGLKMADAAVAHFRERIPRTPSDDAQKAQVKQTSYFVADVEQYAARYPEAEKAYEDLIKIVGVSDDILGRKAGFYKAIGRRDEARAVYGRYVNAIDGQAAIAHSYREEQKYLPAIPIYENLVTQDGKNGAKWQWELAITYRDAGKYKEAIAAFRQTDRFPEDTKQMAYCHRALGEYKEALALYGQVLTAHEPSAPEVLLEIARTYEKAGQKESAIKSFQQVCKRFPKAHQASVAHAHLNEVYKITFTLGGTTTE